MVELGSVSESFRNPFMRILREGTLPPQKPRPLFVPTWELGPLLETWSLGSSPAGAHAEKAPGWEFMTMTIMIVVCMIHTMAITIIVVVTTVTFIATIIPFSGNKMQLAA